jgi:hypothetical protein
MQTINNLLKDYINIINPKKLQSDNTNITTRDEKINKLINEITGDGNLNTNKKIVNIKAKISDDTTEKQTGIINDKLNKKITMHEFYSPSSEF